MKSIWSGSISFGLINIPVKLYSATQDHLITFDLLHKKDLSPIRYARVCKAEEKEIPYQDLVKGYEYQKGEYVIFNENDFQQINIKKTSTIEIIHFTKNEQIDSIFFEKPYFLEPGKGGKKPYVLLREALKISGTVAVAKFVLRNREHLAIVRPYENALILDQMRFIAEIRSMEELELPATNLVEKKEINMAIQLIKELTQNFKPEKYKDEYVRELQQAIDEKIKGVPKRRKKNTPHPSSKLHDITSLLQGSLQQLRKPKKSNRRKAG